MKQIEALGEEKPKIREIVIKDIKLVSDECRAKQSRYPEIVIPGEFIAEFERKRFLTPGQVWFEKREVQDELRIRYLQLQL